MTKYERNALKLVNRIRKAEGRKLLRQLPKGFVEDSTSCPLARALNKGKVEIDSYITAPVRKLKAYRTAGLELVAPPFIGDEEIIFKMPKSFAAFVDWFDEQEDEEAKKLAL